MGCNCKAKKDSNKLIKTIEEINKSKSRSYIKGDKLLLKSAFKSLSILIYFIFSILCLIFLIPLIIYVLITKKTFTIKSNKFLRYVK